jgi:rubrerythrin
MSDTALDILKEAILLERRGRAFYQKVAGQAQNEAVREFFETMVAEENHHMDILGAQLKSYRSNQKFAPLEAADTQSQPLPDLVLSDEVKQQLATADFEAAAISAAMLMEERAVKLYGERATATGDPQEKDLYQWLADWEKGHLSFLADLDKDLKAAIWDDNQFWPF